MEAPRAGQILDLLLRRLQAEGCRHGCDVVVVAREEAALAAAQAARLRDGAGAWPELGDDLKGHAAALAGRAGLGELSLFVGAGISAGAGLPVLPDLLRALADRAGL